MPDAPVAAPSTPAAPNTPTTNTNPVSSPASTSRNTANTAAPAKSAPDLSGLPPSSRAGGTPDAPATPETKAEIARRKYTLKTDGVAEDWEGTDEDIVRELQKSRGASKRMQEAAEKQKRITAALARLNDDPFADDVRDALGVDLLAKAEEKLAAKYKAMLEQEALTPEDRTKQEYEAKVKAAEDKVANYEKAEKTRKQNELNEKVWAESKVKFEQALESEGIEKSYETLRILAEVGNMSVDYGLDLTPQQMAAEVKSRMSQSQAALQKQVLGGLTGERLLSHLGDGVVKAVLAAAVAKAKAARGAETFTKPAAQAADPDDDGSVFGNTRNSMKAFRKFSNKL